MSADVGCPVAIIVGLGVSAFARPGVGLSVGGCVGLTVGLSVGLSVGIRVGLSVGLVEGESLDQFVIDSGVGIKVGGDVNAFAKGGNDGLIVRSGKVVPLIPSLSVEVEA